MIRANLGNQIKKTLRLGLFGFAACSVTVPLFAEPNTVTLPPLGTNEQQVQKTAELIRKKLVTLPNYGVFDDLSFIINGSEVDRDMDKQIIGMAVNRVPGVFSVNNDLTVVQPNAPKVAALPKAS